MTINATKTGTMMTSHHLMLNRSFVAWYKPTSMTHTTKIAVTFAAVMSC